MSQLDALRKAVAVSPDNVPLLFLLAQALLAEQSFTEARDVYDRILRVQPDNPDARRGLINAIFNSGRVSEAVVRLEKMLQEAPADANSWILLSRMLLKEGSREQAVSAYEKALELRKGQREFDLEKDLYGQDGPPPKSEPPRVPVRVGGMGNDPDGADAAQDAVEAIERPAINFNDVGGMESCKEEIRMKILYPLQNPALFRAYGKAIGGGVLLYGPPGCGKTLLSRATAGEIKANFLSIGIHQILDLWLGNSEKNLHQIFEVARDRAPCVLFFDEVDALAADRNDLRKSAGRTLINQFLAEMDGTTQSNDGVLILGATNAPWHIDPAFRRPGRFDRVLFVPPPDEPARAAIIEIMAKGKPADNLDVPALARKTKDFSGADIKAMFDQTIERSLAVAMKEGRVVPITTDDLLRTAKSLKPSTRVWFESARNYAMYANQGGFYNDVLSYLGLDK
jgi:AAA+ superfamily predicted ATPase